VFSAALHTSAARAQWVQTNGPYGGDVMSITSLGTNIFIGTAGGVFESTDSGTSWQRRSNGLPASSYWETLATYGSNIFAGTNGNGVYRSTDSGTSWVSASNGLPNSYTVQSLVANNSALFIPEEFSSYVSTDDGNSWTQLDTNLTKFSEPRTAISFDSATYFAGNWITKTTDDGKTWIVVALPGDSSWDIFSLMRSGNILYAAGLHFGVNRSTDSGKSWVSIAEGLPYEFGANHLASIGNSIYAGNGDNEIYRSNDSGNTWTASQTGLPAVDYMGCLASNNGILFAGFENSGIYRSIDSGATWIVCNLPESSVNTMTSSNDNIFAGAVTGFFLSTDNGTTWQPKMNGMQNSNVSAILADGENLFVGTQGGKNEPCLFETTSKANSWNADTLIQGYNINTLFRSDSNLLAGGSPFNYFSGSGFFESTDDGILWNTIQTDNVTVISFVKTDYALYATTNSGLYYTFSNGSDWSHIYYYTSPGEFYDKFAGASVLGQMGNMAWLAAKESQPYKQCAIFYTDDMGNWQPVADTSVPEQGMVTAFASSGMNLFIAADSAGIFLTTDSGAHWMNENLGLGDSNVTSLAIQGNELLAGTATSGVWRRPLAEMIPASSVASGKQIADTISVYPDPASGIVTVSCPNLNGVTEANLISETGATVWHRTITANGQSFQLDFTGVANGAYRLDLQASNASQASKIVLQR
jgi:photosystem II stability/assembly factor-like uncharacterized protein